MRLIVIAVMDGIREESADRVRYSRGQGEAEVISQSGPSFLKDAQLTWYGGGGAR